MIAADRTLEAPPLVAPATHGPAPPATPAGDAVRLLAEAEALTAANRHDVAVKLLDELWTDVRHQPALALRHRLAASWAEMYRGRLPQASELLQHAEAIVASPQFDAADRAEVMYRRGCVALKSADVAEATALFTRALELNENAPRPRTLLSAHIYEWRSRCHQFRRDWDPARRDADRALEAATAAGDELSQAHALFQASNVAERQRQWLLARFYAEQALELYRKHDDVLATARILNNLGGLDFLLGDVAAAERTLAAASAAATEARSDADVAQAASSLAQVYLRTGRPREAREHALSAIEMLTGRTDFLDELGNAQLVVAKAIAAEGDGEAAEVWLESAEETFRALGSASHLALAWVARGDLARSNGDVNAAAALYRRAAEALQDWHF